MFYLVAAGLLIIIGFIHSYLGEKYILIRLFRKEDNLPKLFGGTDFTKNTLRFAWHLTTVAWFGFAALLLHYSQAVEVAQSVKLIIGVTFIIHGIASLIGAKGRHLSWPIFLLIGFLTIFA